MGKLLEEGRMWILPPGAALPNPKSETRNPKPEPNSNAQWSKAKNRQQGSGFGHSLVGAWGLIRASSFEFRVSALWMAAVPRCAPERTLTNHACGWLEGRMGVA